MDSGFKAPISIKSAIDKIFERKYLLPAIQRKFVWNSYQIEMLFDSIMRGYPINSFMFWEVKNPEIKSNFKFYEFIEEYREFFKVNNPDKDTTGVQDFSAVIDGQQRLTSLYIGLRGTYAYKMPRKWWYDNEENIPTRRLYLNLLKPVDQEYDNQKQYDFVFLSESDLKRFSSRKDEFYWFEVRKIMELDDFKKINDYLINNNLFECEFARDTLIQLYQRIYSDKLINYYLEEEQAPDKVLEVFIRTNSGGTALSFSDLLMSIASANWERTDARKEIDDLVTKIYTIGRPGFVIDKDFILKTCLVLFIDNIKFQLKNFDHKNVEIFEDNWEKIKESILAGFTLMEKIGFNNVTLRAKNAVIPIIYFIYYKGIASTICNPAKHVCDRKLIQKWVNLSLLKSIFGGQTDSVLTTLRRVIKNNLNDPEFPLQKLMDEFKSNPTKNYSLEDDFIEGLLQTQYESADSFYLLSLLYPNLDYFNQDFHKDHLHPKSFFGNINKHIDLIPNDQIEFYKDVNNWNSIANLQLLNNHLNSSKLDSTLKSWAEKNKLNYLDLFLPENIDLDIINFKEFVEKRKSFLVQKIKQLV